MLALAIATTVGACGLAAGGTAGALLGARLAGAAAAGLPLAVLVLGSAAAAVLISCATVRIGRGRSLALGYAIGVGGAGVVVLAAAVSSFGTLLVGSALLGAANAAIFLTRYAAAAIGGSAGRGRALGIVFFGTAVGALVSSSLLGPSGRLAAIVGLPSDCGLYLVAMAAYAVAGLVLVGLSTSRVPRVGGHAALLGPTGGTEIRLRERREGLSARGARASLAVLAATNLVMVAVMAVAPVRLQMDGMTLQIVGVAISIHVAGMFAPAPASGWLADRVGGASVATAGGALLIACGVAGALAGGGSAVSAALLAMLGVGWNLGVVGGSTSLTDTVPAPLRPHAEGIGEVAMGVAAAVAAPLAGAVSQFAGLPALWLACAGVATAIVVLRVGRPVVRPADGNSKKEGGTWRSSPRRSVPTCTTGLR